MNEQKVALIAASILAVSVGFALGRELRAQVGKDNRGGYSAMAPVEQYLMDRDAEIDLARSAAPDSISGDAKVLVLGRHGYETAVEGKNDFVCLVDRSWMLPFDRSDFWNPEVRLPACMNTPAARFRLPLTFKTVELALAGVSATQMSDRLKAAYANKELPPPEDGSICYMILQRQHSGDQSGNTGDFHLMFRFRQGESMDWGAGANDSPAGVPQYPPQFHYRVHDPNFKVGGRNSRPYQSTLTKEGTNCAEPYTYVRG